MVNFLKDKKKSMKNKSHLVFYAFVVIPIQIQASTTLSRNSAKTMGK